MEINIETIPKSATISMRTSEPEKSAQDDDKTYVTLQNVSIKRELCRTEIKNRGNILSHKRKSHLERHIGLELQLEHDSEDDVFIEEMKVNCEDTTTENKPLTLNNDTVNSTENKSESIKESLSYTRSTQTEPSDVYDFDEEDDLEMTEKTPKIPVDLQCRICHEVFDNALNVLRHKREKHTFPKILLPQKEVEKYFDSQDKSTCPICQRPLNCKGFKSLYVKHLMTHTVGVSFRCKICKLPFKRKYQRASHEQRHIVKKPPPVQDTIYNNIKQ